MTLSTGARWLKRGDTFDPEDHRMTHRLGVARALLDDVGIKPTVEHDRQHCEKHPENVRVGMRNGGYCWDSCKTTWPEWSTDEMFNDAFAAADHIQNLRRESSQAQINRLQAAKAEAGRVAV